MDQPHPDAARIDALGGPTKVAEKLGLADKPGAAQRVSNWKRRGIPAVVLLNHPEVFNSAQPSKEAA